MSIKSKIIFILTTLLVVSGLLLTFCILEYRNNLKPQILDLQTKNSFISKNLESLSTTIIDYFRQIEKKCGQFSAQETIALVDCINSLTQEIISKPKLTKVSLFNPKGEEPGYIVIVNVGDKPLESEGFKLYWNNVLQDSDGCEIKGKIKPQFPCKLKFHYPCKEGDVLEVFYGDQSILIETKF